MAPIEDRLLDSLGRIFIFLEYPHHDLREQAVKAAEELGNILTTWPLSRDTKEPCWFELARSDQFEDQAKRITNSQRRLAVCLEGEQVGLVASITVSRSLT